MAPPEGEPKPPTRLLQTINVAIAAAMLVGGFVGFNALHSKLIVLKAPEHDAGAAATFRDAAGVLDAAEYMELINAEPPKRFEVAPNQKMEIRLKHCKGRFQALLDGKTPLVTGTNETKPRAGSVKVLTEGHHVLHLSIDPMDRGRPYEMEAEVAIDANDGGEGTLLGPFHIQSDGAYLPAGDGVTLSFYVR